MYLCDTNFVSELRRRQHADPQVWKWALGIPQSQLHLSVISLMELEVGVLSIERRDTVQGALLRKWFQEQVVWKFEDRILPVDQAAVRYCARLHVPDPRPERDALIAATAFTHGLTLVTRNEADFAGTGVSLLNPWKLR